MTACYDHSVSAFCLAYYRSEHFMGHSTCEQHKQIWITDIFHAAGKFGVHFSFTRVFFTKLLVTSLHTFVSAYYHYAHFFSSFHQLATANRVGKKVGVPRRCNHFITETEPFPLRMERKRLRLDNRTIYHQAEESCFSDLWPALICYAEAPMLQEAENLQLPEL